MSYTIVAQATPPGLSGLAIIRISGDKAIEIADTCFVGKKRIHDAKSHIILYGNIVENNELIDDVTCSIFKAPHSYTGEDVIEFGTHGGKIIPTRIIEVLMNAGCRYAEPGEFTRRAFINGKIDLVQAEAVADIIHSISVPSATTSARQLRGEFTHRLAVLRDKLITIAAHLELDLDFADDNIDIINEQKFINDIDSAINTCQSLLASYNSAVILREGFYVAIAGAPNAGKSTLFNALLGHQRAIVSDIAGTTRDYIEEPIIINNIAVKLVDTAGLRDSDDIIEVEGIKLAQHVLEQSNLIILLNDITKGNDIVNQLHKKLKNIHKYANILIVHNKCDLIDNNSNANADKFPSFRGVAVASADGVFDELYISAKSPADVANLRQKIGEIASHNINAENDVLLNERQYHILREVQKTLETALAEFKSGMTNEVIAIDVRHAGQLLGEITGQTWNEEVLNSIFSKFCIGK